MGRRAVVVGVLVVALAGCGTGPSPTPPSTSAPSPSTPSTAATELLPEAFGAAGDGTTDDTAALQRALDSLAPDQALRIGQGKVYRHADILTVSRPDVRLVGTGTLLATDENRSEVLLDADGVVVDGPTLRVQSTSRRGETFEEMKLRLAGHAGIVVRNVTIDGSSAAGIYVGSGVSDFLIEDVHIRDTRADGIHITADAHDGVVRRPVVERSGDDGVAIVSYQQDKTPVRQVLVDSPTVRDMLGGRGVSVVGGEDITYRNVSVQASSSAAIYIASEGAPYFTFAPKRVTVDGATLTGSNTGAAVDHGAFLVYSGNPGSSPEDVTASDVRISGTRAGATSQVGIRADRSCSVVHVALNNFSIEGGGPRFSANVPTSSYTLSGWQP